MAVIGHVVMAQYGDGTMADEQYNGWTNWETWNANLWLTNDPGTYEASREIARSDALRGEDHFVAWVEEVAFEGLELSGLGADLLRSALERIDYVELREALRED